MSDLGGDNSNLNQNSNGSGPWGGGNNRGNGGGQGPWGGSSNNDVTATAAARAAVKVRGAAALTTVW